MYALFYIIGAILVTPETDPINPLAFSTIIFEAVIFLVITHFYRHIIINMGWLQLPFSESIPRILLTIVALALEIRTGEWGSCAAWRRLWRVQEKRLMLMRFNERQSLLGAALG